jgi:hypothetical protein
MGFLDSIKSLLGDGAKREDAGYWVFVRCHRCGEAIKTRVDLQNDLSLREEGGYAVNKTLVGSQICFERIEVALTFDENRQLVEREIVRGDFISAEEFGAAHSN